MLKIICGEPIDISISLIELLLIDYPEVCERTMSGGVISHQVEPNQ